MKTRDYLSPTAIKTFYEDVDKFYKMYLCDVTTPREPQTLPMAIGSAFDAHVKSYLHAAIYGKGVDPRFEFQTLFETQVEKQNRDPIMKHGEHAFNVYKTSGALNDLLVELQQASQAPEFEIELKGKVADPSICRIDDMILLGKPDVYYKNKDGNFVILDWKVNGYFAKSAKSPNKGYLKLRTKDGISIATPMHKDCVPITHNGMIINGNTFLEDVEEDWATQLAIYGWILGESIGSEFICCIDQLACGPSGLELPNIRIAEHKCRISSDFQKMTFVKAAHVWDICKNGHVYRSLSKEESDRKCKTLDEIQRIAPDPEFAEFTKKPIWMS